MPCSKGIKRKFFNTLKGISECHKDSFPGIGMLLYETNVFPKKYYSDLRPSFSCPKDITLGKMRTIEVLSNIADFSNPLHDGFIFFNEKGEMTHVSQYFAPSPRGKIVPNESYGTRYRTAQYGSYVEGVILTGVVNHDCRYFVFQKGRCIGLDSELE